METQIKEAIEPVDNDRDPVRDPTRDFAIDPVENHRGNLTRGAQLQSQQDRSLTRGANLQPQQDVDVIEVDPSEILDPRIVEIVADQTTINRADNLSDFVSDLEIKARVAVLRNQKKRTELKAELEHLECKKTDRFIGE